MGGHFSSQSVVGQNGFYHSGANISRCNSTTWQETGETLNVHPKEESPMSYRRHNNVIQSERTNRGNGRKLLPSPRIPTIVCGNKNNSLTQ